MKALNTPFAKGLGYVIFWILISLFFGSCQKDPVPHRNLHSLIFERDNEASYLFADFHPDSLHLGDTYVRNGAKLGGGIKYEFWIEENTVFVKAHHSIEMIRWYPYGTSRDPDFLTLKDSIFSHKFSHHEHSDGHFIVQIPFKD